MIKIENPQKIAFLGNCASLCKVLSENSGKATLNLARQRFLFIIVYETLDNPIPLFILELLKIQKQNRNATEKYELNLDIHVANQVSCNTKTLKSLSTETWNSLPRHLKSAKIFEVFKKM